MDPASIHLEAWVVALIAGTLIPLVTGLITKLSAQPGTKAIIALALSAAVAVLNAIVVAQGEFLVRDITILFATTFTTQVVTYLGLWKPVGGGASPGAKATAEIGVG
jgi:hypothetical protein